MPLHLTRHEPSASIRLRSHSGVSPSPGKQTTLLIVEHEPLLRAALHQLFDPEPAITVAAATPSGEEALSLVVAAEGPIVVLLDGRLPGNDDNALLRKLVRTGCRVLLFAVDEDEEHVLDSVHAGAVGYLPRTAAPEELIRAVCTLASGGAVLSPTATHRLLQSVAHRVPLPRHRMADVLFGITNRELDILRLVAHGLNNAEIAAEVHLSQATIKGYIGRMLAKLRLRNRTELAVFAYAKNIVEPDARWPESVQRTRAPQNPTER